MSPRRLALLLPLLALVPIRARAAAEDGPSLEEQVDALVLKAGITDDGPGVGVLVVSEEGVLLKKAYGLANLETHAPIKTSTTFELASVSKQITGSAVMLLIQRGKVHLEDDIRKHLPELPVYDAGHPITVDHLSRHTSGLPDYLSWEGEEPKDRPYLTNADLLPEFSRRKDSSPLESVPGEKYDYSNSGYMLLGTLVEKVSGQSFGQFLSKEFFGPLGMKTAWVHESPKVPTAPVAVGYTLEEGAWKPTWAAPTPEKHEKLFTTGDGSVWASLDDMVGWDRGLRDGTPVKKATLTAVLVPGKTNSGEPLTYAMGWNLEFDDDGSMSSVWHSGTWGGFENYITHVVESGVTVVVLSNRGGFEPGDLANAITNLLDE